MTGNKKGEFILIFISIEFNDSIFSLYDSDALIAMISLDENQKYISTEKLHGGTFRRSKTWRNVFLFS